MGAGVDSSAHQLPTWATLLRPMSQTMSLLLCLSDYYSWITFFFASHLLSLAKAPGDIICIQCPLLQDWLAVARPFRASNRQILLPAAVLNLAPGHSILPSPSSLLGREVFNDSFDWKAATSLIEDTSSSLWDSLPTASVIVSSFASLHLNQTEFYLSPLVWLV